MSVTDDYLRHCAVHFGNDAVVLDFGCGDARFVEMMLDAHIKAYGIDIPSARASVEARARKRPDLDIASRVSFLDDPERIPMPDHSVDVIVSNTVFEHVPTLDAAVSELARILKTDGCIYTVFPLRSAILEQYANLLLLHRISSRKLRLWYLKAAKALGIYHGAASPEDIEQYVSQSCFYRTEAEIHSIFHKNFTSVESDAQTYVEFKGRALVTSNSAIRRIVGKYPSQKSVGNFPIRAPAAFRGVLPIQTPALDIAARGFSPNAPVPLYR